MTAKNEHRHLINTLTFPSGLSVKRAKERAKEMVVEGKFQSHTAALDYMAVQEYGSDFNWVRATIELKKMNGMNHDYSKAVETAN